MKILFIFFSFLPFFSEAGYFKKTNKAMHSIKKKIVLLDDNKLLLVEIDSFLGVNSIDEKFCPRFERCPRTGWISESDVFSSLSTDSNYDLHKAIENNQQELTKFIIRFHNPNVNSTIADKTPLQRAIQNLNPALIKILLTQSNIIINHDNLLCVKERFDCLTREYRELKLGQYPQLEIDGHGNDGFLDFFQSIKSRVISGIGNSKKIGKMLINHLGLYTDQSRISKQGIIGLYGLPPELAVYIATFIH